MPVDSGDSSLRFLLHADGANRERNHDVLLLEPLFQRLDELMADQVLAPERRRMEIDIEKDRRIAEGVEADRRRGGRVFGNVEGRVETGQYVPRHLQRHALDHVKIAVVGDADRHSESHIHDAGRLHPARSHVIVRDNRRRQLVVRHDDDIVHDRVDLRVSPCDVDDFPFRAAFKPDIIADAHLLCQKEMESRENVRHCLLEAEGNSHAADAESRDHRRNGYVELVEHENDSGDVNGRGGLNLKIVQSIRVIVPPLPEQMRFVGIAQQADKSKFDNLKSQFIEMFGRVSDKQPKYPIMKLSECCSYISDGSHFSPEGDSNGSYPMLSVKDMTETGFSYSDCKFIGEKDYNNLVQNGCKPLCGDVLVAKDGSYFKYAFALSDEKEQAILSSIAILRPIQVFISSRYLAYYMLTDAVIQLVEDNYLTGTAIKRVILKGFKEIPIIVPPLDSQNVFVRVLERADKSKFELKQAIEKIDKVMRALMQ